MSIANHNRSVVAFVPLRTNSKRLPDKNRLLLGDKPLCWYVFSALLQVKEVNQVYAFCSRQEDFQNQLPTGVKIVSRPSHLDADSTLGMDIYQSFIQRISADVYLLAHATSPFILPSTLSQGIQAILSGEYDSAFSVERKQTFAWWKDTPLNYQLQHIPRTQDLEPVYLETSAFYAFTKDVILGHRRIGSRPKMILTDDQEAVDIDLPSQFRVAQTMVTSWCQSGRR